MAQPILIKSAAVPHYSKANGKVVFAVRVCPNASEISEVLAEPYTVYRRWDEFLDFSARLSSSFPTIETDEHSHFNRVPRLSRKMTIFVTASTHASRMDELDLFVRHLFALPRVVTRSQMVHDFFTCKSNGLDGRSPPSPSNGAQDKTKRANDMASPTSAKPSQSTWSVSTASLTPASSTTSFNSYPKSLLPSVPSASSPAPLISYESIRGRQQPLRSETAPTPPSKEATFTAAIKALPRQNFKPSLTAKRSTPDLRRFLGSSADKTFQYDDEPLASTPYPPQLQLDFKFPKPPASTGNKPTPEYQTLLGVARDTDETVKFSSSTSQRASRQSFRSCSSPVESTKTVRVPLSPSSSSAAGDNASLRTASTARPTRHGSTSRGTSPFSFASVVSDDMDPPSPIVPSRPAPGALRHFRSLQDIRNVILPHPELPEVDSDPFYSSKPLQKLRSRSNSGSAATALADVAESNELEYGSSHSPVSNHFNMSGTPPLSRDLQDKTVSPPCSPRFQRPSLNNLRNITSVPVQQLPQLATPFSCSMVKSKSDSCSPIGRQGTASVSSLDSLESGHSQYLSNSQSSSNLSSNGTSGLGLDFSSSSRESLDFSEYSSVLGSPDSAISPCESIPPTPPVNSAPFPSQEQYNSFFYPPISPYHDMKFEKWQHDVASGSFMYNNHIPPLPFFPTPQSAEMAYPASIISKPPAMQRRRSARSRGSSLHTPVLETILASPVLGGNSTSSEESAVFVPQQQPNKKQQPPSITLKVMTDQSNFMLKLPKSLTLAEVREKVEAKCLSSGIEIGPDFNLSIVASAGGTDSTIKAASPAAPATPSTNAISVEDEADWQTTVRLATTKLTVKVSSS